MAWVAIVKFSTLNGFSLWGKAEAIYIQNRKILVCHSPIKMPKGEKYSFQDILHTQRNGFFFFSAPACDHQRTAPRLAIAAEEKAKKPEPDNWIRFQWTNTSFFPTSSLFQVTYLDPWNGSDWDANSTSQWSTNFVLRSD